MRMRAMTILLSVVLTSTKGLLRGQGRVGCRFLQSPQPTFDHSFRTTVLSMSRR